MQFMIAIQDKLLRETLAFALQSQTGAKVLKASSTGEALGFMVKGEKVDFLIVEAPTLATDICKYLESTKSTASILIYLPKPGTAFQAPPSLKVLGSADAKDVLAHAIGHSQIIKLALNPVENTEDLDHKYSPISCELLKGSTSLPAALFIRINAKKYLKLYSTGSAFNNADSQKILVDKKIETLFVAKDEAHLLLSTLNDEIQKAIDSPKTDSATAQKIATTTQKTAVDLYKKLGLTPEVKDLMQKNIIVAVKAVGNSPNLKALLAKITLDKTSYIASHSTMLAQISCAMAAALEWASASTFQKLTMVSLFHDLAVDDNELAQINSKADLVAVKDKYTPEVLKSYLLHAATGSELMRKFNEVPPDVDVIISQHHERPDGTGFPRGMRAAQIAPLAAVFIVAHDFMSEVYKQQTKFSMEAFIASRTELYNLGTFKKALNSLKDVKMPQITVAE